MRELFKFGADPNARDEILKTLLFDLCSETFSDRIAKIEAFVEAKVDPNLKDDVRVILLRGIMFRDSYIGLIVSSVLYRFL